jgi:hypothetical protein
MDIGRGMERLVENRFRRGSRLGGEMISDGGRGWGWVNILSDIDPGVRSALRLPLVVILFVVLDADRPFCVDSLLLHHSLLFPITFVYISAVLLLLALSISDRAWRPLDRR